MSDTVNKLVYGELTFTDDEITDGEAYRAIALLSDALEIGTLQAELHITDADTGAALSAFRRNDKLLYYHRDKLQGTYYIERVQRTGRDAYTISANDAVSLLEQSSHYGGIYTGQTVAEVVADICNIPYLIQSKFAGISLYGWLPIATRRANLAQVLFAIGAHAKVDQNGTLRIEALWDGVSSTIPPDRVKLGDSVTYESKVTEVSVLEHQYIPGTEEIQLFEGTAQAGDVIQFTEPAHDLVADGVTIMSSGANYAVVSAGSGTLTGQKYVHTTRDVRVAVSEDDVPNVIEVKEATLVSLTNSAAVAQRLAGYYQYTESLEHEVVYEGETPGDVVAFEHPYGGASKGCVRDAAITLGGRLVAEEHIAIGYTPPKPNTGYYDTVEVITSNTTWTVPEGVTSVRVVLISGGTGGYSGLPGEPSETQTAATSQRQVTSAITYQAYTNPVEPGEGGDPGEGGGGGKVYQVTLDVTPGDSYPITIGQGGSGGVPGEESNPGQDGTDTTFGAYSSANGTSSPTGFLEEVSGVVYATPGDQGMSGARGSGYDADTDEEIVGPSIVADGVAYGPGTQGEGLSRESGNYGTDYGYKEAVAYGGYGGGAAYKASGLNGGDAQRASTTTTSISTQPGPGGQGADAQPPEPQTEIGRGGTGGNGGGGGGSPGGASCSNRLRINTSGGSTLARADMTATPAASGPGGSGSTGGLGGPGGVILYYSRPNPDSSGPVKDKNGLVLLDRLGRRLIV